MGRLFGRMPSDLMMVADPTVAYAIDTAATFLLTQTDREHAEILESRRLDAMFAVMTGGRPSRADVKWDTVEEW